MKRKHGKYYLVNKEKINNLKKDGFSYREIAKKLNLSGASYAWTIHKDYLTPIELIKLLKNKKRKKELRKQQKRNDRIKKMEIQKRRREREKLRKQKYLKIIRMTKERRDGGIIKNFNTAGLHLLFSGREYTREIARMRDGHTCQKCGRIWRNGEKRFDIHHLDGLCGKKSRKYDRLEDIPALITYCHKCHMNLDEVKEKMMDRSLFVHSLKICYIENREEPR